MHIICVEIWQTGEWPDEWTFSTFIPLPKKGDLKQCENYRTIATVLSACLIYRHLNNKAILTLSYDH